MLTIRNKETQPQKQKNLQIQLHIIMSRACVFQPLGKPKGNTCLGNYHLAKWTQVEIGSIF